MAMVPRFLTALNTRSTLNHMGGVILNLDSGMMFSLNSVGALLWNKIEQSAAGISFAELLNYLSVEFNLPPAQLSNDLTNYLEELRVRQLLRER